MITNKHAAQEKDLVPTLETMAAESPNDLQPLYDYAFRHLAIYTHRDPRSVREAALPSTRTTEMGLASGLLATTRIIASCSTFLQRPGHTGMVSPRS